MNRGIILGLENLHDRPAGCVATIGNFDGVHLGHQRLVAVARALAEPLDAPVVAVTFEPPPARVLMPDKAPAPLMQPGQKYRAMELAGADLVLVLRTTPELLHMDPQTFVRDVLVAHLAPRHMVEGQNFFFGRDRSGSAATLRELGPQYGFETHVPDVVLAELSDGQRVPISSSLIRRLVREGRVADAARCLGRPYSLLGRVVVGQQRGRGLNYPTANLDCGLQLRPADGVYAGWALVGEQPDVSRPRIPAAISVGTKPTFGDSPHTIEAHLLDWQGDLYGQTMELEVTEFIRPQVRFPSTAELRMAMDQDVRRIRGVLGVG